MVHSKPDAARFTDYEPEMPTYRWMGYIRYNWRWLIPLVATIIIIGGLLIVESMPTARSMTLH